MLLSFGMFKVGDRVIMKQHKRYYYSPILHVSFDTGTIEKFSKHGDSALIRDYLDFGLLYWILNENISSIITLCA